MKTWKVIFADEFAAEFSSLSEPVQDELLSQAQRLAQSGPLLGRPRVDTLKGSRFANMKELRFDADGSVWRAAFAFNPVREAIILIAGSKSGVSEKSFYKRLIDVADARYSKHLSTFKA